MTKTLDQLMIEHGSDKATEHTRTYAKPHGYTVEMAKVFDPIRDQPLKFCEIGVGGGESIRAWLDYFPNAQIYGIDFVSDTNIFNRTEGKPYARYTFSHGDQTDRTMWACFRANCGVDWDVILDDGGHFNDQTIISFEEMWPHVKSGGLYIIEDLGVASSPGTIFVRNGFPNHMDWLRDRMHAMNRGEENIASLNFTKELAIFRKKNVHET